MLNTRDFCTPELVLEAYTLDDSLRIYIRNISPRKATLDAVYVNDHLICQNLNQVLPAHEVTVVDLNALTNYTFRKGNKVKLATREGQLIIFWIEKIS